MVYTSHGHLHIIWLLVLVDLLHSFYIGALGKEQSSLFVAILSPDFHGYVLTFSADVPLSNKQTKLTFKTRISLSLSVFWLIAY